MRSSRDIHAAARRLRAEGTAAEDLLWSHLRDRGTAGLKFRRQYPVDRFVLDFYCAERRIAVEMDGPIHDERVERDAARTAALEAMGIRVIRIRNEELAANVNDVLTRIVHFAGGKTAPSPACGRGGGEPKASRG